MNTKILWYSICSWYDYENTFNIDSNTIVKPWEILREIGELESVSIVNDRINIDVKLIISQGRNDSSCIKHRKNNRIADSRRTKPEISGRYDYKKCPKIIIYLVCGVLGVWLYYYWPSQSCPNYPQLGKKRFEWLRSN